MSLLKLMNTISTEGFSEEETDLFMDRKKALSKMGNYTKKMALSAIPLGALAVFGSKPAVAQSGGPSDIDILNYALTLEVLEKTFYDTGVAAMNSGDLPDDDITVFQQIMKHEDAHVAFLQSALGDNAIDVGAMYDLDFTAGGNFDPFHDYPTFQTLSIGFEDTGVRAYKGQAGNISNKDYLSAALRIHSVEARHASEVRRVAAKNGVAPDAKGWVTGSGVNAPAPIQPVYGADSTNMLAEGNTTQGGVDVTQFGNSTIASESFDEPVDMAFVLDFLTGQHIVVPK